MKSVDFVNAARHMIGTPFVHQGRKPFVALDCAGLVVCAAKVMNYDIPDQFGYSRTPFGDSFEQAVKERCDIVSGPWQVGDLALFAFRSDIQHIAIISSISPMRIIHAFETVKSVVEHDIDAFWRRKMRGVYRLRGVE